MRSPAANWRKLEPLPAAFYAVPAEVLAPRLLGKLLIVDKLVCEIVETEAYHQDDPASHSFAGVTGRTWPMFEAGGLCYVYLIYGVNYCMNVVAGEKGDGQAVLLRAGRPLEGVAQMKKNRGNPTREIDLMNGPGKMTQAMGVGPQHNGLTFSARDFKLVDGITALDSNVIERTPRIGISKAREALLRFSLRDSPYVSKARPYKITRERNVFRKNPL